MRHLTAKELLIAWRYAVQEITAIQRQINKMGPYGGPGGSKGIILTDMPRGTNDPTTAAMQALDHYEEMLNDVKQEKAAILEETERMLKTLEDTLARVILRHYYGGGLTDERIARALNKARETVTRRRVMAENYLQKTFTPSQNVTDSHKQGMV